MCEASWKWYWLSYYIFCISHFNNLIELEKILYHKETCHAYVIDSEMTTNYNFAIQFALDVRDSWKFW